MKAATSLEEMSNLLTSSEEKKEGVPVSILDHIKVRSAARPRVTLIHGLSGLGKTTWAASFPDPVIVQTEDGCADIEVASTPVATKWDSVLAVLNELASPDVEHGYKTVVLDSADHFEGLVYKALHLESFPSDYGRGEVECTRRFKMMMDSLISCRARGLNVVIIAHSALKSVQDPFGNSYDRYSPKLSKRNNALVTEMVDEIGFARQQIFMAEAKVKFGTQTVAKSTGEVSLDFGPSPAFVSKKRLPGLPDSVDLWSWGEYAQYVPFLQGNGPAPENPEGTV